MDPDANLRLTRELVRAILAGQATPDPVDVVRLAELVDALDHWLKGGGALPAAWGWMRPSPLVG